MNEQEEVAMQVQLLYAGVLSVAEVREMRGLAPVAQASLPEREGEDA